jgi:NAD(P)-dependent dehydrogenase (short-subunit alcohol dehydrogenase family)
MATGAALITGGAKRIGQAIALALAESGFDIALHFNTSKAEAEATQALVEKTGQKCLLLKADLADPNQAAPLVRQAKEAFPHLSLLVNNASIFEPATLASTSSDFYDRNFNIHLKSPFFASQEFAQLGLQGQIINIIDSAITDTSTDVAGKPCFAYLLSKKALLAFTQMAAAELAPAIRVNAICPGPIISPKQEPGQLEMAREKSLLKRKGDPKYIVQGVNYLLANEYVTGECLYIDGGRHVK